MSEKLTLQDLTDLLAEKQGMTKKDAELFLRGLFDVITETIEQKDSVRIRDFGTFKLVLVNSRKSVDVNTGEDIEIPAHYKLSFAPDKSLRDLLNTPFAHFESVLLEDGVSFDNVTFDAATDMDEEDDSPDNTVAPVEVAVTSEIIRQDIENKIEDNKLNQTEMTNEENEKPLQEASSEVQSDMDAQANEKNKEPEVAADDDEYEDEDNGKKSHTTRNIIVLLLIALLLLLAYFYRCEICALIDKDNSYGKSSSAALATQDAVIDSLNQKIDSLTHAIDVLQGMKLNDSALSENGDITQANAGDYPALVVVKLKNGDTLRKLALRYYGNKSFWVYIYQENIRKIRNYNHVLIGSELVIPAKEKYGINANSSHSVTKAELLEEIYFAKY